MSRQSRFLTYLFCDLVDSTGLIERYDAETAFELIDAFRALCRREIEAHQGAVASTMGDGVLACFGYPLALESHAEAACRCALRLLEQVKTLSDSARFSIRIGAACGRGVLDLRWRDSGGSEIAAVSSAANLGARLQAEAEPDQVLVSQGVYDEMQGLFEFGPRRRFVLKGFEGLQAAYPLHGYGSYHSKSHQRGEASPAELVGRDAELGAVLAAWREVRRSGGGASLLVRGPGGIGKTTLLRAVKQHTAGEALQVSLYSVWFEQHTALHPFRIWLEDLAASQADATLATWLARYLEGAELAEARELIAIVLGRAESRNWMPNVLHERTLACLSGLLLRLSREQPLLMLVEDAHWLDPSSTEVLHRVMAQYATAPVLVLGSSRPKATAEPLQWQRTIDLARLQEEDVGAVISGLDPQFRLNDEVRREIARKAGGVPLLIREFTKATLAPAADGEMRLVVPETLLDSFVAQLDPWAEAKDILDAAAAAGGGFSARLIALAVERGEDEVSEVLQRMVAAGVLHSYRTPEAELYDFSHTLLRDAAYATLLQKQRNAVHARVLGAWQRIDPQFAQNQPSLAAHHLDGIGAYAEAIKTLLAGAQACFARSQFSEAGGLVRRALKLLPEIKPQQAFAALELQLQTLLGLTLTQLMGFGDDAVNQAFSRAWEICRRMDPSGESEFQAAWGIWAHQLVVSETVTAVELVETLGGIARRSGKPELDMLTRSAAAVMRCVTGAFARVPALADSVRASYDLPRHRHLALAYSNDPLAQALMFLTHSLSIQGDQAGADRARAEVLQLGDSLGLEFLLPYIRIWSWGSALYHGAPDGIVDSFDQAIALAKKLGIAFWIYSGMLWKAHAYVELGQPARAIPYFDEGLGGATQMGLRFTMSYFNSLHAWTLARTGHARAALPVFAECLRRNIASGELFYQAEIHRLHGEALLLADPRERPLALRQFSQGLTLARFQEAWGWEGKILRSLAESGLSERDIENAGDEQ